MDSSQSSEFSSEENSELGIFKIDGPSARSLHAYEREQAETAGTVNMLRETDGTRDNGRKHACTQ
eukprot:6371837-Prymnesium_polylepis.1